MCVNYALAILALSVVLARDASANHGHHSAGVTLTRATKISLNSAALLEAEKLDTRGTVSTDRKSLSLKGKNVTLVVRTGPAEDMLSYRIEGLKNPTLVIQRGANLKVLFVNTDDDMIHDLRFTAQKAPFNTKPNLKQSVGSLPFAHQTKMTQHAEQMILHAGTPGTYTYLCTMKGHAVGGMYGILIVK